MIYLWKMVISYSYVKLPEGIGDYTTWFNGHYDTL